MNVTTTTIKCNHFFCILNGKKYPATYRVEQVLPSGNIRVTNSCESCFVPFSEVINEYPEIYTVIEL